MELYSRRYSAQKCTPMSQGSSIWNFLLGDHSEELPTFFVLTSFVVDLRELANSNKLRVTCKIRFQNLQQKGNRKSITNFCLLQVHILGNLQTHKLTFTFASERHVSLGMFSPFCSAGSMEHGARKSTEGTPPHFFPLAYTIAVLRVDR